LTLNLKAKPATGFASVAGFWKSFLRLLACFYQRREHDRQPATCVVVMPVRMMAAIGAKHRAGLIAQWLRACQILDRIYKIFQDGTGFL